MLLYLNRGLILEQAIRDLIHEYFLNINLEEKYKNFHVTVTTEHPFAELYMHEGLNASDSFPCIIVTTQEDRKPYEFSELAPHTAAIGIDNEDLEEILKTTESYIDEKGNEKTRELPGLCSIADEKTIDAIKKAIEENGMCYGLSIRVRRRDTMGIEIWAENIQLKNELYEQLRLFIAGNLRHVLEAKYPFFDIALFDGNVTGHRSNNFNMDFDVALSGAHIAFEVNYCVEQIVLNTELKELDAENIIVEVLNRVKE